MLGLILGAVIANSTRPNESYVSNNYYGNPNNQYNNGYYDGGYEKSTTYVNNYYYNDPYYRPSPQVSINYIGGQAPAVMNGRPAQKQDHMVRNVRSVLMQELLPVSMTLLHYIRSLRVNGLPRTILLSRLWFVQEHIRK